MSVPSPDNSENQATEVRPLKPISRHARLIFGIAGLGLLGLLIVARTLEPSPEGRGTHRQLMFGKMPPCGFLVAFGKPCPSCGMTTSWSHLTRGNVVASVNSNVGGFLLGLVSMFCGAWFVASAIAGRWIWVQPVPSILLSVIGVILLVTLGQWLTRMWA